MVLDGPGSRALSQLCISPDHVYVARARQDAFAAALLKHYDAFWPKGPLHEDAKWGSIINPAHHERVRKLLARTKGEILRGGESDGDRRVSTAIVKNVAPDDALMEEYVTRMCVNTDAEHVPGSCSARYYRLFQWMTLRKRSSSLTSSESIPILKGTRLMTMHQEYPSSHLSVHEQRGHPTTKYMLCALPFEVQLTQICSPRTHAQRHHPHQRYD